MPWDFTCGAGSSLRLPPPYVKSNSVSLFLSVSLLSLLGLRSQVGREKLISSSFSASNQNGPGPTGWGPLPTHCGVKSTWPSVWPSQALEAKHLLGCPKWAQDVTATFLEPTPSLLLLGRRQLRSRIQMPSGYGGSSQSLSGCIYRPALTSWGRVLHVSWTKLTLSVIADFLGKGPCCPTVCPPWKQGSLGNSGLTPFHSTSIPLSPENLWWPLASGCSLLAPCPARPVHIPPNPNAGLTSSE